MNKIGKLEAVDLRLELNGMSVPVKIMSNRGIVLYENFSEALSLNILSTIQEVLSDYVVNRGMEEFSDD